MISLLNSTFLKLKLDIWVLKGHVQDGHVFNNSIMSQVLSECSRTQSFKSLYCKSYPTDHLEVSQANCAVKIFSKKKTKFNFV